MIELNNLDGINATIENNNEKTVDRVVEIKVDKIIPNEHNFYDEEYDIENLVQSILQIGQREALLVTKDYTLLSGHRRLNALKRAGIDVARCIIVDNSKDDKIFIVESNRHRKNTAQEDRAEMEVIRDYYLDLEKRGEKPKGRIVELIAEATGSSVSTVKRRLKDKSKVNDEPVNEIELIEVKVKKKIDRIIKELEKNNVYKEAVIFLESASKVFNYQEEISNEQLTIYDILSEVIADEK